MRKPYLERLADLQAAINNIDSTHVSLGNLARSFLAHEAATSRNLKKSLLLRTELLSLLSSLPTSLLSGSLPYPPHCTLTTIYSLEDHSLTLRIYNQKTGKFMYSQSVSLNKEGN